MKNLFKLFLFLLSLNLQAQVIVNDSVVRHTINVNVPNNDAGQITPLTLRTSMSNIVDYINTKASTFSPVFSGNVSGITKSMVGLANVNNTADSLKPVSNAQKLAINSKLHNVSSKTELTNLSISGVTKVRFDNSDWELKSGNVASNGGSYAGTVIRVSSSVYWERVVIGYVKPQSFGAKGDLTADDTQAIQNCLNASLFVDFGGVNCNYKVTGTLTLRTGHTIEGGNCTIRQSTAQTIIFNCGANSNIKIEGFNFVGYGGADYLNNDNNSAIAISCLYGNNIQVKKCTFKNFSYTSLNAILTDNVEFTDNTVVGIGSTYLVASNMSTSRCYGVSVLGKNLKILKNTISETSQGVVVGSGSQDIDILDNYIFNVINQHGMYLQEGLKNLKVHSNTVKRIANIGIKVQNNDAVNIPSYNVSIQDNIIDSTGLEGILVINSTGISATQTLSKLSVTGNIVSRSGQDGINIQKANNAKVNNNIVNTVTRDGISFTNLDNSEITYNRISNTGNNGIRNVYGCSYVDIQFNNVYNPAQGQNSGEVYGLFINAGTNYNISRNIFRCDNAKMVYGMFFVDGSQLTSTLENNQFIGATSYGARLKNPVENFAKLSGNSFKSNAGDYFGYMPTTNQIGDVNRQAYSSAIPTTGTWEVGDRVHNTSPTSGGYVGWICTVSGTPGTWKGFGLIQ